MITLRYHPLCELLTARRSWPNRTTAHSSRSCSVRFIYRNLFIVACRRTGDTSKRCLMWWWWCSTIKKQNRLSFVCIRWCCCCCCCLVASIYVMSSAQIHHMPTAICLQAVPHDHPAHARSLALSLSLSLSLSRRVAKKGVVFGVEVCSIPRALF